MQQMEDTKYDPRHDHFVLPSGGTVKVTECIQLEGSI